MSIALFTIGNPKLERMEQRLAAQNAERRENWRIDTMVKDSRDILELLKEELAFIEQGGYGRSVRTPWLPKSVFEDSLACINYAYQYHAHPCTDCHLIDFVQEEQKDQRVPCHFIPLNEAGETIEDLEAQNSQWKLEATLKRWMKGKIAEIEEARALRAATQTGATVCSDMKPGMASPFTADTRPAELRQSTGGELGGTLSA
jgi:hypothetical protein